MTPHNSAKNGAFAKTVIVAFERVEQTFKMRAALIPNSIGVGTTCWIDDGLTVLDPSLFLQSVPNTV